MQRFAGKTVLVTGAARGIGRATAEEFANEGARVIATDIDATDLAVLAAARPDIATRRQDVTDEAGWGALMAELGTLDVLVNNAGMAALASVEDTSAELWRRIMAVNLESVFFGTRAGIAAMKGRGGVIANVASIAANIAEPMFPAYNATKGGVAMFTKAAAIDCARKGYNIRINSIHPGYTDTRLVSDAIGELPPAAGAAFGASVAAGIPIGRMAQPLEIARPILFLASDDAAYMIGSELVVDGGFIAT